MSKKKHEEIPAPVAALSRRQLLAGAAVTGGLLATGARAAAPVAGTTVADPQLRDALRRYGGEFGQLGSDTGGHHGDL